MEKNVFQEIRAGELTAVCHTVMAYVPRIHKLFVTNRRNSSFLYILKGQYCYRFGNESLLAGEGSLVYLPRYAEYTYQVLSADAECLQCEMDFFRDGTPVAFGNRPVAITNGDGEQMGKILREMLLHHGGASFLVTGHLFHLLSFFADNQIQPAANTARKKIQPAVSYIRRHYREKISIAHLAEICYLSQSQLRRLFQAEMGQSPVEMKNQLLAKAACDMLRSTENSVGEIAESLGFETIYAFSRFFKQAQGVSPRAYAQSNQGK